MNGIIFKSDIYIVLMACLGLSACGEFSYKRGANAADLQQVKQSCQARFQEESAVEKCLADNGWIVRDFEKEDPLMAVSFVDNNRMVDQGKWDKTAEEAVQGDTETSSAPDSHQSSANSQNIKPAVKPKDPMDVFLVSSWWSIGKGPDALKVDTNECVATLGEEHRPDGASLKTTRGFLICMRGKNWRALQAK